MIKKKQDTRPIHYLLFSQVWLVAGGQTINVFVLKQESFFSFIYYIFINFLVAYCSRQLVLIIMFS